VRDDERHDRTLRAKHAQAARADVVIREYDGANRRGRGAFPIGHVRADVSG